MKSVKISLMALSFMFAANLNAQQAKIKDTPLTPIQKGDASKIINRQEFESKKRNTHEIQKVRELDRIKLEPTKKSN